MKNSILTKEELEDLQYKHEQSFFSSRFDFLNSHNGLRKGQYHLLIGAAGSGKSSLVRSIAVDSALNENVMIHLSEEAAEDWKYKFYKSSVPTQSLENIYIYSELNDDAVKDNVDTFFSVMVDRMLMTKAELVIIDNLSTSWIESLPIKDKERAYAKIKEMAYIYNVAVVVVMHTKKGVDDNYKGLIQGEDVRGLASIYNHAPYAYVFQNFRNEHGYNPTIAVKKSRYHDDCTNKWYALTYNRKLSSYMSDRIISYELLNKLFKERFQLGKDSKRDDRREQESSDRFTF